jgi:ribosomal-protein-alanine N-acetyltransferase
MIVLVLGNVAASRKMLAQVRDSIAALDAPAVYIDAIDGVRFDPVSAMRLDTGEAVMARLEKTVAMLWEAGARRLVIPVPTPPPGQPAPDLGKLAFWLKRAARQHVYKLDVDQHLREKTVGTWSPDVLELTLRQMAKSLGPRQEVTPWLPSPPRYETDRLLFTWPTDAQVESYFREIIGTDVFKTLIWNGPNTAEDLHDYWWERRQVFARGRDHDLSLAVIERASGEMIGGCSVRPKSLRNNDHDVWDMGYLIAKRWHGRGYGTEMVKLLVDIAFREREAQRLFADAFVGNQASRRILEKNGFVLEGLCRSVIGKPDGRRDEWKLAMTREDWEKRGG